jgi:hypothetical protein
MKAILLGAVLSVGLQKGSGDEDTRTRDLHEPGPR